MPKETECPLCSGANNCQAKDPTEACWCTQFTFSDELNEKIKNLPLNCICSTCAQKLGARKTEQTYPQN